MRARRGGLAMLAVAIVFAAWWPAASWVPLPIFDVHMHYNARAWQSYPPADVIAAMKRAGVVRALVSSTPDDGTLTRYAADAERFAPELRPYREGVGKSNWTADAATPDYLAKRLAHANYVGIGEIHLHDAASAQTNVVRAVVGLEVTRGILLHVHSGAAPVEALFKLDPRVKILWAHAGRTTTASEVAQMLDAHENLWAELSRRSIDVAPGGWLSPYWRKVLLGACLSNRIFLDGGFEP